MKVLVQCALLLVAASAASSYTLSGQDVIFHLFTSNNPGQSEPLLPTVNSIAVSAFSISVKTIIVIHDFDETSGGNANAFLAQAYLSTNVNYIAVDWSAGGNLYTFGLGNAPQVGQVIASFINILANNFNYDPSNIEIVGVGLGAHIAGIAGRQTVSSIPRIVALNPSLHGWTHHPDKLRASDADLVEVLHTTAGITGYDLPLGDVDFYANGGSAQPGCANPGCSHTYAYVYFAESITAESNDGPKFIGTACESYEQAAALQCQGERDAIFGGADETVEKQGIYLFYTNILPPFAAN